MPGNLASTGAKIALNTKLLLLVNTVLGSKGITMPGCICTWGNGLTPGFIILDGRPLKSTHNSRSERISRYASCDLLNTY